MEKQDYQLNIAVTRHFSDLQLADEFNPAAPVDTLVRLIWRSSGVLPGTDKQAYIRSYAAREGIKPAPEYVSPWDAVNAKRKAKRKGTLVAESIQ
jgi:hypothetical protein